MDRWCTGERTPKTLDSVRRAEKEEERRLETVLSREMRRIARLNRAKGLADTEL